MSSERRGIAAGLAGASLLASLLAARTVASASDAAVFLAGHELHWGCIFKRAFGIPCPTCGMTRSVLLALDGHLSAALGINPAGPLLVCGALLLGACMLHLALYERARPDASLETARRRIVTGASIYGGLMAAVLLAHWVYVIL